MCQDCGCSVKREVNINKQSSRGVDSPLLSARQPAAADAPAPVPAPASPDHAHATDHDHPHPHPQTEAKVGQTLTVNEHILEANERLAERNRGFFMAKGLLVLNVLSSPGSGKTTFIQKTVDQLRARLRIGVVVGDLATDNDAIRLRATGAPVVQITTGTVCHLDAEMVARAIGQLDLDQLDLLVIENVGNLVCPAAYDLGEDLRVVVLSVTEGEDKPLKYPPVFHSAQVAVVSKMDLAGAAGFDRDLAISNLRRISHHARIFEVSAKTGLGMETWCDFLSQEVEKKK
jgi:hydrogenase nickel incorporation protein HypB